MSWGFQESELDFDINELLIQKEITEINIKPYNKTHIMLSFEPAKFLQIQKLITQLRQIEGIEIEQSSN